MKDLHIVLAGGTGFVGTAIADAVIRDGGRVTVITRQVTHRSPSQHGSIHYASWDSTSLASVLDGADAVINLSGANVGGGRWTAKRKREIVESRIHATRMLVDTIAQLAHPPTLVQASGIGYYGNTSVPTTEAMPAGASFLSVVCKLWEDEAARAEAYTRVVTLRIGVVLDVHEGALAKLKVPTMLFLGGPLGSGRQWMPWVHRDDMVRCFLWAARSEHAHGVYNLSAPEPVPMSVFANRLAKVLHRPCYLPVPSFVLRILLGEQADIVLHGQYVIQRRLEMDGFRFNYRDLSTALTDLFARP